VLSLFAVGRLRDGPEAELFARYNTRLRPKIAVIEIAEARGASTEVKRREGEALLGALPDPAFVVALDSGGALPDSEALARLLERWLAAGRPVCFLVGGAEGLDRQVIARADYTLSLGRLTWPHLLARVMLVEQVYRAQSIAAGHPYHRSGGGGGRPCGPPPAALTPSLRRPGHRSAPRSCRPTSRTAST
jgi:23S rRNA (pseudouridine1915-N3)-methyltransferase